MTPDEIRKVLDLCRDRGVSALEIDAHGLMRVQFFPQIPGEVRMPSEEPPEPEKAPKPTHPDVTLMEFQKIQDGQS